MKTSNAIILVCAFFISAYPLLSQTIPRTVISSNGDHSYDSPGRLHWTVGESVIDYFKSGPILSTGFHQGQLTFPTFTNPRKKVPIAGIEIYPNPFFEEFFVHGVQGKTHTIRVVDLAGREVTRLSALPEDGKISLAGTPSGTYFLEISNENESFHYEKLIKIQ